MADPGGKRKPSLGQILTTVALVVAGVFVLYVGYCFVSLNRMY